MTTGLEITLTAAVTLVGGVLLLIFTEFITKLFITPFLKLRETIGETSYSLVYYANYLKNCSSPRDETFTQAKTKCRELACRLRAEAAIIVGYSLLDKLGLLPDKTSLIEASRLLISISNTPEKSEKGENTDAYKRIAIHLDIPEIEK